MALLLLILITPQEYLTTHLGPCPEGKLVASGNPKTFPLNLFLRTDEAMMIGEMTRDWVYPFYDEGFVFFTVGRYLEDVYDRRGLSKIPLIELEPGLEGHYRYLTGDQLVKSSYAYRNLKNYLGEEGFDRIIIDYLQYRRRGGTCGFWDFIDPKLGMVYKEFIYKDGFCDLYIKSVRTEKIDGILHNEVTIGNQGNLILPYGVLIQGRLDSLVFQAVKETTFIFNTFDRFDILIDPDFSVLEKTKRNNCSSNRPIITYKINRNILIRYPIFLLPYIWYTQDEGVATGGMIQAGLSPFWEDLIFLRSYYAWRRHRLNLEFSYDKITTGFKIRGEGRFDANENRLSLLLSPEKVGIGFSYSNLFDTTGLDNRDFEIARTVSLDGIISLAPVQISAKYSFYQRNYLKFTSRAVFNLKIIRPAYLRIFLSRILGDPPVQEKIFLSGSLYPSILGRIITQKRGPLSTQEHLNFEGGPWLIGYYGKHRKGNLGYGVNLKISFGPIFAFCDLGSAGDGLDQLSPIYDLGIGIKITKIMIQFPLYISNPDARESKFKFRFVISI